MSASVHKNSRKGGRQPRLVFSDADGRIFDVKEIGAAGRRGREIFPLPPDDLIPLPPGSELFHLAGRTPLGYRPGGEAVLFEERDGEGELPRAMAAFLPPAYTQLYLPAYEMRAGAPLLPLFAYTALTWMDGGFWVPAVRVDEDRRQDPELFDPDMVEKGVRERLAASPGNRLYEHLSRCALEYFCPAARNLFLGRWEAPLPASPTCNASCVGCISRQPSGCCPSTQDRITFVPTAEEIAEVALDHFRAVPDGVASFGQGCEGEPLMVAGTIEEALGLIRKKTDRGTLNLNTNGSRPEEVGRLARAGLQAIRVSINSARPELYHAYFNPADYRFEDVVETIRLSVDCRLHTSLNYFVFPGLTDQPGEIDALIALIEKTELHMIQWRNLNIDPERYLRSVPTPAGSLGVAVAMKAVRSKFPRLRHGYFNPAL